MTEGMIIGALGLVFAAKATDEASCREIIQHVYMAIYSAFRMKPPK